MNKITALDARVRPVQTIVDHLESLTIRRRFRIGYWTSWLKRRSRPKIYSIIRMTGPKAWGRRTPWLNSPTKKESEEI